VNALSILETRTHQRARAEVELANNLVALQAATRAAWATSTAQPIPPTEARQALLQAHEARAALEASLESARKAARAAQAYAVAAKGEAERFSEVERTIASDRAVKLKAAIKSEGSGALGPTSLPAGHAQAKADALVRLDAAEQTSVSLAAEEAQASRAFEEAGQTVKKCSNAVVCAVADELAARVQRLEGEAALLREQLGISVAWRFPRTERLSRVQGATDFMTNSIEHRRSMAAAVRWAGFAAALENSPDAEVRFE
jgi:hypothetical protein